ncbi:MAG: tRNA (N6-isopentenyl adenosine(37)-C2)-methylthiotransferase MiaB [Patescibacteria group bacterium]|nr:tRNA (N6-isopentenyl adenosine(37)-C2)-methylthiotransferase MiaB [Patescibacteria group bacterium]
MPKFHILTWGCQMNYSDTERIAAVLVNAGFVKADSIEDADVVVFNTCSVRQRAEDKVLGLCRKIKKLKLKKPGLKVILTGCMALRLSRNGVDNVDLRYKKEIRQKLPWIDHFLDIGDLSGLYKILTGHKKKIDYFEVLHLCPDSLIDSDNIKIGGFVPITKGCNNFCTYCIVPYTRGKEVSVDFNRIYSEVKTLVGQGSKLITLLGQNVNSWKGVIDGKNAQFPKLLARIADIKGEFWVTYLTAHPKDFSDELIDVMSRSEKICPYVNLPFQSGSNRILKKMNRKYTRSQYLHKIEKIRRKIPNVRVSTDVIVGFPGESDKDFERSLNLLKTGYFGMAYISEFSPRKGTPAALLEDNIPQDIKKQRKKIMVDVMGDIIEEQNLRMVGTRIPVLVTSDGKGKTFDLRDVIIHDSRLYSVGTLVSTEVIDASSGGLKVHVIV